MSKISMVSIWAGHLNAIELKIRNTEAGKDGKLMQLCKKKSLIEKALINVMGEL